MYLCTEHKILQFSSLYSREERHKWQTDYIQWMSGCWAVGYIQFPARLDLVTFVRQGSHSKPQGQHSTHKVLPQVMQCCSTWQLSYRKLHFTCVLHYLMCFYMYMLSCTLGAIITGLFTRVNHLDHMQACYHPHVVLIRKEWKNVLHQL